jgi:hypothetical protein
MASLLSAPGQLLSNIRTMQIWRTPTSFFGSFSYKDIALYAVAIVIVGFIIFMLLGKDIFFVKSTSFQDDVHKFWEKEPLSGNYIVPFERVEINSNYYTCILELNLINTRPRGISDSNRHIFHKGSDDILSSRPFGLPNQMNPGVFLDPNVNDILVFVDTVKDNYVLRESVRILDIPLDTHFYFGVIINKRVLEVYINCKLEATKLLDGEPVDVENAWFGTAGANPANAKIKNLSLWNYPLDVNSISQICKVITKEDVIYQPTCAVDKPRIDENGMNTTATSKNDNLLNFKMMDTVFKSKEAKSQRDTFDIFN